MELVSAPQPIPVGQRDGVQIAVERLGRDAYLALYAEIGTPHQWDQRPRMPPAALDALLASPSTATFVLRRLTRPVGLCEFVDVGQASVELTHFGLVPDAQGQGFGPLLLNTALLAIWRGPVRRIWLHTDTNDHPTAVSTYERAGFRIYDRRTESFPD